MMIAKARNIQKTNKLTPMIKVITALEEGTNNKTPPKIINKILTTISGNSCVGKKKARPPEVM
jgi:hypothetical protein